MDNSLRIIKAAPDTLTVANRILTPAAGWQPGQQLAPGETPVTLHGQPIGIVDWSTAKADAAGLWVKRILARRSKFIKLLEELIERGLVGTRPVCQAGKAAGQVVVCRDVLVTPGSAAKSLDWQTVITARALGLVGEKERDIDRLRLKLKIAGLITGEVTL